MKFYMTQHQQPGTSPKTIKPNPSSNHHQVEQYAPGGDGTASLFSGADEWMAGLNVAYFGAGVDGEAPVPFF